MNPAGAETNRADLQAPHSGEEAVVLARAQQSAREGPFLVVLNPGSGHQATDLQQVIASVFQAAGREHEFLMINSPAQVHDVARRALGLAQARHGVVVAAGGDGTISAVAQVVLGSGCPLGVLPQGTFNYFGRVHALAQDAEAASQALLRARVQQVQVGQVNDQVFLVNASLGLYPQLLQDREKYKQQFGRSRLVAFGGALLTLLRWRGQLQLRLQTATGEQVLRTTTLFVGNNYLQLERVGLANADDVNAGLLAAVVVRPVGRWGLLGLMLRGLLGRLGDAEEVQSFSIQRLRVEPRGLHRIKVAIDGEVQWMRSPLVFEVAPEPLLLLVPAPADQVPVQ